MAKDLGCSVAELIASKELRLKIKPEKYLTPTVGMPTLKDILQELEKPGRDPRGPIKIFEFDKNVRTINDLREGMELPGIVGNITNFGCICRHRYQREWSDPSFAAGRPFRFRPE